MMGFGRIIRGMDRENSTSSMDPSMKVIGIKTTKMGLEHLHGLIKTNMKGNG